MHHLIAASAALALLCGGCIPPAREAGPEPIAASPEGVTDAEAANCALTVRFGSYGMGTDRATYDAVDNLLSHDTGVTRTSKQRWGREGEVTLCAETRSARDTERLFGEVRALFPIKPRGPLTVESASGMKFEAGVAP